MSSQVLLLFYISQALVIGLHPTAVIGAQGDANSLRLGGSATVTSDYIFRGVSQTMGRPAIQASVDFEHDSGFYAYVWSTNVDFFPDAEIDDGARTEIDLAAGYVAEIGDRWSIDTMFVRYVFPGTRSEYNYDYNELMSTLRFDDRYGVTLAYAGDVDGTATESWFYRADASFELPGETKQSNFENVPGWNTDTPAADSGVEPPGSWPGVTDGEVAGFMMGSDPSVWNLTDHVIASGEEILLQIDLQDNWTDGGSNENSSLTEPDK